MLPGAPCKSSGGRHHANLQDRHRRNTGGASRRRDRRHLLAERRCRDVRRLPPRAGTSVLRLRQPEPALRRRGCHRARTRRQGRRRHRPGHRPHPLRRGRGPRHPRLQGRLNPSFRARATPR
ncbi:MAG: hypothetical protein CVT81_09495 [Alphaproteobacteria bacterium HGW-Alphaproteobacteria-3]|nr:MAG: hypothetical protein CVT81_09495 [Alphaproteobacteria bacterium HGW-Alphaproteobacteria-3]